MGVPSFFSNLYKNYNKSNFVFLKNNNINNNLNIVNNLYLDANCLIHP